MDEFASERTFWIDDGRLVFNAARCATRKPIEGTRSGVYLWNERDRSLTPLEDVAFGLCYRDGVLSSGARRGDERLYVEGPLGAAKTTPLGADGKLPTPVRCRAVPEGFPPGAFALVGGGFPGGPSTGVGRCVALSLYDPRVDAAPVELAVNPTVTGLDLHRYSE